MPGTKPNRIPPESVSPKMACPDRSRRRPAWRRQKKTAAGPFFIEDAQVELLLSRYRISFRFAHLAAGFPALTRRRSWYRATLTVSGSVPGSVVPRFTARLLDSGDVSCNSSRSAGRFCVHRPRHLERLGSLFSRAVASGFPLRQRLSPQCQSYSWQPGLQGLFLFSHIVPDRRTAVP